MLALLAAAAIATALPDDREAETFLVMGAEAGIPQARRALIELYAHGRQAKAMPGPASPPTLATRGVGWRSGAWASS